MVNWERFELNSESFKYGSTLFRNGFETGSKPAQDSSTSARNLLKMPLGIGSKLFESSVRHQFELFRGLGTAVGMHVSLASPCRGERCQGSKIPISSVGETGAGRTTQQRALGSIRIYFGMSV